VSPLSAVSSATRRHLPSYKTSRYRKSRNEEVTFYSRLWQSQRPRGLKRRSAAARMLRLWVRIASWAWMSVCCEFCALSGRGLYDGLITRPEESCRRWCVVVCDLETSWMRRPWPTGGWCARNKQTADLKTLSHRSLQSRDSQHVHKEVHVIQTAFTSSSNTLESTGFNETRLIV
jgi:hypothetical protein